MHETKWYPSQLLSPTQPNSPDTNSIVPDPRTPYAILILNQPLNKPALTVLLEHASLLVCADAGADKYMAYYLERAQASINNKENHLDPHFQYNQTTRLSPDPKSSPSFSITTQPSSSSPSPSPSPPQQQRHIPIPDAIVGDLDSISNRARTFWTSRNVTIIHDGDQYSTDFTKSLSWIRTWSRTNHAPDLDVIVLGGLGGRIDQGFSQIHHMVMATNDGNLLANTSKLYLLSEVSLSFLLDQGRNVVCVDDWDVVDPKSSDAEGVMDGSEGCRDERDRNKPRERPLCSFRENVGVIPILGPSRITLHGFEWDVTDWDTAFGGQLSTSNHIRDKKLIVDVQGPNQCLFTIELAEHLQLGYNGKIISS